MKNNIKLILAFPVIPVRQVSVKSTDDTAFIGEGIKQRITCTAISSSEFQACHRRAWKYIACVPGYDYALSA